MVGRPEQRAARRRERARGRRALGHRAEGRELDAVHRVAGLVGAGEVADDHRRAGGQDPVAQGGPVGRLQAEAVHPGVELDAEGVARQRLGVARPTARAS